MTAKHTFTDTLVITRRTKTVHDDGSISWRDVPARYRVDLAIDVRSIMLSLGSKAAGNKSKTSKVLNGDVVASVRYLEGEKTR